MSSYHIRKGTVGDLPTLKHMMLTALETDPDAFSVLLSEYSGHSDFWWETYLFPFLIEDKQEVFFGFEGDEIASMGGLLFDDKIKKEHVASMVWVYTKPEFRGKGYSQKIITEMIDSIKAKPQIKKFALMVASSQTTAIELYKKFGFELNGVMKRELKIGDKYVDVYIMEKLF